MDWVVWSLAQVKYKFIPKMPKMFFFDGHLDNIQVGFGLLLDLCNDSSTVYQGYKRTAVFTFKYDFSCFHPFLLLSTVSTLFFIASTKPIAQVENSFHSSAWSFELNVNLAAFS